MTPLSALYRHARRATLDTWQQSYIDAFALSTKLMHAQEDDTQEYASVTFDEHEAAILAAAVYFFASELCQHAIQPFEALIRSNLTRPQKN